ncbi:hypothetical protein FCV25MIE_08943 [Fagus crenata]
MKKAEGSKQNPKDAPNEEEGQQETSSSNGPPPVKIKDQSLAELLHGGTNNRKGNKPPSDIKGQTPASVELHGDKKTHGTTKPTVKSEGESSVSEQLRQMVKQNERLSSSAQLISSSAHQLISDHPAHQSHPTSSNEKQRDSATATIKLPTGGKKHDNKPPTGETSQSENEKASDDEKATNPERSEKPKKATQNDGKK